MADTRLMLDMMPLRSGLATAGKRATLDERQLWGAQNVYPDLDGLPRTRPGTTQYAQRLVYPNPDASYTYLFYERLENMNLWALVDSASNFNSAVSNGAYTISLSTGSYSITHVDNDVVSNQDCTVRFTARITNPEGADTTGGQLRVEFNGDTDTGASAARMVAITATGVGTLVGGTYTHPTGEDDLDLDLGGYHNYEFRYDQSANSVAIYVDAVLVYTISLVGADTPTGLTDSVRFTFTSGTDAWTVNLTDVMFIDTITDPFVGDYITDVGQYVRLLSGGSTQAVLLSSTRRYLFIEINERGAWQPLLAVSEGRTRFLAFRNDLLLFDDGGQTNVKVFRWNGVDAPEQIDDAPPVRFATEHRTRVFGAGDRAFPLRAYYTASRRAHIWFAPEYDSDETFEEVTEAGFIDIPAETGDEITGLYGEYYGSVIVITQRGIWRISGSSPASYRVDNITKKVGGESPDGMVQIGNDLFIVGRQGVVSVQTAEAYGDLQTAMPSGAIADVWSSLPDEPDRVDRTQLIHSFFDALPSINLAVLGMRGQGSFTLDKMYALATGNTAWFGTWTYEPTCFKAVEVGLPTTDVLLSGTENGYALVTGLGVRTDNGAQYTTVFKSPMLSGRTLDPALTHQTKRWRCLRLFIMPQHSRDFTLRWRTDDNDYDSTTLNQTPHNEPTISDTFRLNEATLYSDQDMVVIEQVLDDRGVYLHFEIESDYDFVLQGYQVELLVSGSEE